MYMEDPWREIGFQTLDTVLKGSNAAEILPVLSILKELIPRVDISQWKPLWPSLVRLSVHKNAVLRRKLYEIFQKSFDLIDHGDPDFAAAILRGCVDADAQLAAMMQNFLADKLPADSTMERALMFLRDFYCASTEDFFAAFFSHFLLERTAHSQQYLQPIFDHPLDDVPFQDVHFASQDRRSQFQV